MRVHQVALVLMLNGVSLDQIVADAKQILSV